MVAFATLAVADGSITPGADTLTCKPVGRCEPSRGGPWRVYAWARASDPPFLAALAGLQEQRLKLVVFRRPSALHRVVAALKWAALKL